MRGARVHLFSHRVGILLAALPAAVAGLLTIIGLVSAVLYYLSDSIVEVRLPDATTLKFALGTGDEAIDGAIRQRIGLAQVDTVLFSQKTIDPTKEEEILQRERTNQIQAEERPLIDELRRRGVIPFSHPDQAFSELVANYPAYEAISYFKIAEGIYDRFYDGR